MIQDYTLWYRAECSYTGPSAVIQGHDLERIRDMSRSPSSQP